MASLSSFLVVDRGTSRVVYSDTRGEQIDTVLKVKRRVVLRQDRVHGLDQNPVELWLLYGVLDPFLK